jgi:imidazolonepropionase-like amidohydrolase
MSRLVGIRRGPAGGLTSRSDAWRALTVLAAGSRLVHTERVQAYFADRVITETAQGCVDGGVVVVDGTAITWVGRAADLPAELADHAERVDLGAATLLPGLIDAHVHLGFDGGTDPVARMTGESDASQTALMLASARELLSVGVTTARDLGARTHVAVDVRNAIAAGTVRGPRLLVAGAPITTTGGHCWFIGGEADSVDDVRRAVRLRHKAGVDVIKVMATGGFMTPGSAPWFAQYATDELAVIVAEAHRVGLRVAAHVHGVQGIDRVVAAGVDTLEHCTFSRDDGSVAFDPELADRIAASSAYVSPTMNCRVPELVRRGAGKYRPAVGELHARGAKIIASTDAGIDFVPHRGYPAGLAAMVEFGVPAAAVLTAATSQAATALGVADLTGRLAPGLDADLVAVGGDPRTDPRAYADLRLVLTRGTRFHPDDLPPIPPMPADWQPPILTAKPARL